MQLICSGWAGPAGCCSLTAQLCAHRLDPVGTVHARQWHLCAKGCTAGRWCDPVPVQADLVPVRKQDRMSPLVGLDPFIVWQ
jgi:hypothetical protein